LLGFEGTGSDQRVIVLDASLGRLALAVSGLGGIVPLSGEDLLPGDPERREQSCISQLLNHRDDMINLLDIPLLLARLESA
jgi:chemotaxis signal transduction protein